MFPLFWVAGTLPAAPEKDIEKQYKEACEKLVCQCACREQLSVCAMQNCHSATPMRAEVREKLQAGMNVDQIVESFVARMGPQVRPAPTFGGFDLAAWIMPFAILSMGLVVVGWIAVKLTRRRPSIEEAPAAVDPRVERELQEFEEES